MPTSGALDTQCVKGQTHWLDPPDGESPTFDQLDETAAGEEPQVGRIEDASLVVVEHPECRAEPRVPVGDVGHAEQSRPVGVQDFPCLAHQSAGVEDVLEDVGRQHDVIARADLGRDSFVEVSLEEGVGALGHPVEFVDVDAGDVVAHSSQPLREQAARTPEVEDPAGRSELQELRDPAV